MLADRLDPDVAEAFEEASAAMSEAAAGAVDDLLLLERLLEVADDDLLRVLGSHSRRLLAEVTAERSRRDEQGHSGRLLPSGEHLLAVAASEAYELAGPAAPIGSLHVVLALFAFGGCDTEAVLERCGIDWRPLRSIARRLLGRGYGW